MDSNLMSCPTCGHSVSHGAGACTYCGAIVDESGQPPQADNTDIGEQAQVTASPPPLPHQQTAAVGEMPDETGGNPLAAPEQSESDAPQQTADSPAPEKTVKPATEAPDAAPAAEKTAEPATEAPAASPTADTSSEPAAEAQDDSLEEWTSIDAGEESNPGVADSDLTTAAQNGPLNQTREDESEIDLIEAVETESAIDAAAAPAAGEREDLHEPGAEATQITDNVIPLTRPENQTETVADASESSPETEAADKSAEDTGAPETAGETQAEPVEMDATEQKTANPSTAEKTPSLEKTAQEAGAEPVKDNAPKNKTDIAPDATWGATSKSSGDTIILEVENEVEPAAAGSPDKTQDPAQSETRAEGEKKNKAKADLAKAQALKKQKAALAKAQALKKQKLALAKAAVLKRKKAMQARSQADIETPKKKGPAAAAAPPQVDPGPEANSRMQTLLEKYKGRVIGINFDNSADIKKAQLVEANADYFSVFVKDQNLKYSYPLKAILSIIEGKDGVDVGGSKQPQKFIAVIKVYPMVLF